MTPFDDLHNGVEGAVTPEGPISLKSPRLTVPSYPGSSPSASVSIPASHRRMRHM